MRFFIDTKEEKAGLDLDPRFEKAQLLSGLTKKRIQSGIRYWEITTCDHVFKKILERKKYTMLQCIKCKKTEKIWK